MEEQKGHIHAWFGQDFRKLLVILNIVIWAFVATSAGTLAFRDGNIELFAFMGIALFLFCLFVSISTLSQSFGKNVLLYGGISCVCAGTLIFLGHTSFALAGTFMVFLFFGLLIAHWHVVYFERDRLAVHWIPIVRTLWKYVTLAVMLFLMLYVGFTPLKWNQGKSDQVWGSFFKSVDPLLQSFGLPQSHTPILDSVSQAVQKKFPEKEGSDLMLLQKQAHTQSIQQLEKSLGFSVSPNDTFGLLMRTYLTSVWNNMGSAVQSGIRIIGSILFLLLFQPIILFAGNLLSFAAPWMMRLLRSIGMFEIELETAQKERVSI